MNRTDKIDIIHVDDEALILTMMPRFIELAAADPTVQIPREQLSIRSLFTTSDAREAMQQRLPDLLITDNDTGGKHPKGMELIAEVMTRMASEAAAVTGDARDRTQRTLLILVASATLRIGDQSFSEMVGTEVPVINSGLPPEQWPAVEEQATNALVHGTPIVVLKPFDPQTLKRLFACALQDIVARRSLRVQEQE